VGTKERGKGGGARRSRLGIWMPMMGQEMGLKGGMHEKAMLGVRQTLSLAKGRNHPGSLWAGKKGNLRHHRKVKRAKTTLADVP